MVEKNISTPAEEANTEQTLHSAEVAVLVALFGTKNEQTGQRGEQTTERSLNDSSAEEPNSL